MRKFQSPMPSTKMFSEVQMSDRFVARGATMNDLDEMLAVEEETWRGVADDYAYSYEQVADAVATFPEGQVLVRERATGILVAMCNTIRTNYDVSSASKPNWRAVSGDGWASRVHDPNGHDLYCVNLACRPAFRSTGAGRQALDGARELLVRLHLRALYAGARIPDYATYADVFDVEDYIHLRTTQTGDLFIVLPNNAIWFVGGMRVIDELREANERYVRQSHAQVTDRRMITEVQNLPPLSKAMRLWLGAPGNTEHVRVIEPLPDYMDDPASGNYGALIEFRNPATVPSSKLAHSVIKWGTVIACVIAITVVIDGFIMGADVMKGQYGIDPWVATVLGIVSELTFDVTVVLLAIACGRQVKWREIFSLDFTSFREVRIEGFLMNFLIIANIVGWLSPFVYFLVAGFGKLPVFVSVAMVAEIILHLSLCAYVKGWIKI